MRSPKTDFIFSFYTSKYIWSKKGPFLDVIEANKYPYIKRKNIFWKMDGNLLKYYKLTTYMDQN